MATKLADKIREALKPHLKPDEELRSVGYVRSGSVWRALLTILLIRFWYVGITKERAIFLRVNRWGKPDESMRFITPLNDLKLDGKRIAAITPQYGAPQKFRLLPLASSRKSGLDIDEFKEALTSHEAV